jgi:hypothetical protein
VATLDKGKTIMDPIPNLVQNTGESDADYKVRNEANRARLANASGKAPLPVPVVLRPISVDELRTVIDKQFAPNSQRHNEATAALALLTTALAEMAKHGYPLALAQAPMGAVAPVEFKSYNRTQSAELRPWVEGEPMWADEKAWTAAGVDAAAKGLAAPAAFIFVSAIDRAAGSPKVGDWVARDPNNRSDQWLVSAEYFDLHYDVPLGQSSGAQSNEYPKMLYAGGANRIVNDAAEEAEAKKAGFGPRVAPVDPAAAKKAEEAKAAQVASDKAKADAAIAAQAAQAKAAQAAQAAQAVPAQPRSAV